METEGAMLLITLSTLLLCAAGALWIVALRRSMDKQTEKDVRWIAEFGGIER